MSTSDYVPVRAMFGSRLKVHRAAAGYPTARAFARALGIEENRYTRYERGEVEPDLTMLERICERLGVGVGDLLPFGRVGTADLANGSDQVIRSDQVSRSDRVSRLDRATGFAEGNGRGPAPFETGDRVIAWRIADIVAASEMGSVETGGDAGNVSFERLTRTAQLLAQIDTDPIGFAARIVRDQRVAALELAERDRLAGLIATLLDRANGATSR